jgi:hypothetical protein
MYVVTRSNDRPLVFRAARPTGVASR